MVIAATVCVRRARRANHELSTSIKADSEYSREVRLTPIAPMTQLPPTTLYLGVMSPIVQALDQVGISTPFRFRRWPFRLTGADMISQALCRYGQDLGVWRRSAAADRSAG